MREDKFYELMGEIDPEIIAAADRPVPFRQKRGFKIALIAAVLAFAMLLTPIAGAFALAVGYIATHDQVNDGSETQDPIQGDAEQKFTPGGLVGELLGGIDWGALKDTVGADGNVNWKDFFAVLQGNPSETIGTGSYAFESVKLDDGTMKITKFVNNGNETVVFVPETISGAKVTVIGAWAFAKNQNLTHVSLPDTVKVIEDSAFHSCTNLVTVDYPENLVEIGDYAFAACGSLTNCDLPYTLQTLGSFAFMNCDITDVTIPASLKSWGDHTFYCCTNLQSLTIEDGIKTIPEESFRGATIRDLTVPASVTNIGNNAFTKCKNLQSISLPEGLKEIGLDAFAGTAIQSITIPSTVTNMGDMLFSGCENLETVIFAGNAPKVEYFESITGLTPNTAYQIYYLLGADGFTDSEWYGHLCELMTCITETFVLDNLQVHRFTMLPFHYTEILGDLNISNAEPVTLLDSYDAYEAFSHVLTSERYDVDYFEQNAIVLIKVKHTSSENIVGLAGMGTQVYSTGNKMYFGLYPIVKIKASDGPQTDDVQYTYILAEVQRSNIRTDIATGVCTVYAYDIDTFEGSTYHSLFFGK